MAGVEKAQLRCHACEKLLEYDAGAQYVQCFSCNTMNAVPLTTILNASSSQGGSSNTRTSAAQLGGRVLSMLCAICHTTNLAPFGINYVRCGSCNTISQVSHAYRDVAASGGATGLSNNEIDTAVGQQQPMPQNQESP